MQLSEPFALLLRLLLLTAVLPPFPSSLQPLLPRAHAGHHQRHPGPAEDQGAPGERRGGQQPVQPVRRHGVPARLPGAVYPRGAHPVSVPHASDPVAGIRPLPHQEEVSDAA